MTDQTLELKIKTRKETRKKVSILREQGQIPAVLYGHKIKPVNLVVDYLTFEKIFKQVGESTLIDLIINDQKPVKVLVQDYQLNPTTNQFIHIDFHQVRMDEKLHTGIKLKFVGESPAVKEESGVLITNIDTLEVECLPQDLVHEIEVDLSSLKKFDDAVHVSDILVPSGITVLNVPDDVIALVQAPRTDEEMEALEAKPEGEEREVEVEGEEKAEGKEGEVKAEDKKPEEKSTKK